MGQCGLCKRAGKTGHSRSRQDRSTIKFLKMAPSGYNSAPMPNLLHFPNTGDPAQVGWAELISACAQNRENPVLWAEFLRRYGLKIKQFIRGTWRLSTGNAAPMTAVAPQLGGMQQSDLFQATIMRLVEQDCAAIKVFSGTSEDQWLAYLAVIARSVVRESLRRHRAIKRPGRAEFVHALPLPNAGRDPFSHEGSARMSVERNILAQEVRGLCERAIASLSGDSSIRDMLIFKLYFDHDLSTRQIAECEGVNLTKGGVEDVIKRLKDRIRSLVSADAHEAMMR